MYVKCQAKCLTITAASTGSNSKGMIGTINKRQNSLKTQTGNTYTYYLHNIYNSRPLEVCNKPRMFNVDLNFIVIFAFCKALSVSSRLIFSTPEQHFLSFFSPSKYHKQRAQMGNCTGLAGDRFNNGIQYDTVNPFAIFA